MCVFVFDIKGLGILHISRGSASRRDKNPILATDFSGSQWEYLEPILPKAARTGRPRTPLWNVINVLLSIAKSGCQWHLPPKNFPSYKTIFHLVSRCRSREILAAIHNRLRAFAREQAGRRSRPNAAFLDSQTVRLAGPAAESGFDAAKKTKGRKRFITEDTLGYLLDILPTPANRPERPEGWELMENTLGQHRWLRKLWVDGGYSGEDSANDLNRARPGFEAEVVKLSNAAHGFEVLPRRWVVERTFGWLMQCRRLTRDHERTVGSSTGLIYIAMM